MMSQAEFEIKITPEGDVEIEVQGAEGPVCTDLSKFLEDALGDIKKRKFKSSYYQSQQQSDSGVKYQQY